ncbi:retrotransposon polyprotein [Cucumis melo var. makuwa]|uniref:Retrotransposon polyprotein n=1 Tax=Cucumis melo var. makuwa TaxID=1194695 RepID=A0A5A7TWE0_CUCMM|nr:retrotransposon polyprotein [Cucumis melo var. makuwa]
MEMVQRKRVGIATQTLMIVIANASSTTFGHLLSSVLIVKLDEINYSLWHNMVMSVLNSQKIDGFVLGTKLKPSKVIFYADEPGSSMFNLNLKFEEWVVVD